MSTGTTAIKDELQRRLVAAMRDKDQQTADVIRGVRAAVLEETKKKGFAGDTDDALYRMVIERQIKQLEKALPDFERAGAAGAEMAARYRFEMAYLAAFLPKRLDEAATRALVVDVIARLGVTDARQLGRVMGEVMKTHRDEVDAALVRQAAEALLAR